MLCARFLVIQAFRVDKQNYPHCSADLSWVVDGSRNNQSSAACPGSDRLSRLHTPEHLFKRGFYREKHLTKQMSLTRGLRLAAACLGWVRGDCIRGLWSAKT